MHVQALLCAPAAEHTAAQATLGSGRVPEPGDTGHDTMNAQGRSGTAYARPHVPATACDAAAMRRNGDRGKLV